MWGPHACMAALSYAGFTSFFMAKQGFEDPPVAQAGALLDIRDVCKGFSGYGLGYCLGAYAVLIEQPECAVQAKAALPDVGYLHSGR